MYAHRSHRPTPSPVVAGCLCSTESGCLLTLRLYNVDFYIRVRGWCTPVSRSDPATGVPACRRHESGRWRPSAPDGRTGWPRAGGVPVGLPSPRPQIHRRPHRPPAGSCTIQPVRSPARAPARSAGAGRKSRLKSLRAMPGCAARAAVSTPAAATTSPPARSR
uniref:Uncharacterized protein n=1 Tax=Nonomuraea gerenzanensis TaxID=93944 RepID=A0A1M4ECU0_9ACTN|nr:hypothetical protein BN4615_P5994 [Nonomuraea gerenzanensis]